MPVWADDDASRQVPTISLILLTHATVSHLAAYAHCCKNFPQFARIPTYATKPIIDLGRTLLHDLYASTARAATTIPRSSLAEVSYSYSQPLSAEHNFLRQAPTPEEISRYFQLIQELKYMQAVQPRPAPNSPPLSGLTITAYNSGRSLGGTIWHIQHGLESIVYGVDWGQYKENVYGGAAWIEGAHGGGSEVIEQLRKPTALICSSRTPPVLRPDSRDEHLLSIIRSGILRGGTVLIPVDSSARVLELAYLLEHAWRVDAALRKPTLASVKLYLAGRAVGSLQYQARTLLEWMNGGIAQELEGVPDGSGRAGGGKGRDAGPFDFRYLRLLERRAQVDYVLKQEGGNLGGSAKVILATDASLEWGFSRDVFAAIASDPRNLVVLTEVPGALSDNSRKPLARTMWEWWRETNDDAADSDPVEGAGRTVELLYAKKQALDGDDLALYQQWLATQRQLQATLQAGGATSLEAFADAADDASSESSESEGSDNEQQGKALNISTTIGQASRKKVVLKDEDLGITILLKKQGHYDFDVRGRKGRERMFPIAVRRKKDDEFGEVIRPEDYLREEEREEEARQRDEAYGGGGAVQNGVGKKRKWDDVGANARMPTGPNGKRPQLNRKLSADDDLTASPSTDAPVLDELDAIEDKEEEDVVVGPARLVVTRERVAVQLRVAYVDFSGLHTERNLEMLLPLVQPRKLILVGGSSAETEAVSTKYKDIVSKSRGITADQVDVFAPPVGTSVDASVDTNAWVVKLAEPLVKRLKWQNLRGLGIVTITGRLVGATPQAADAEDRTGDGEDGANKRLKTGSGGHSDAQGEADKAAAAAVPTLDIPPTATSATRAAAAQPLYVGELRLADLRRAMQSSGHTAEFRGEGTLVIDGSVAVKKTTAGRVELESVGLLTDGGPAMQMGGTFYAVRRMIYDGLAVVAGG